MDYTYDPHLDRLDTALRAVWRDVVQRRGRLVRAAGADPAPLLPAVDQLRQTVEKLTTQKQVFTFVRACPQSLGAALALLHQYYQTAGDERPAYYERMRSICA